MASQIWAITVSPCSNQDVEYLTDRLNKHPHVKGWMGGVEEVEDEKGTPIPERQHVHISVWYGEQKVKYNTPRKWWERAIPEMPEYGVQGLCRALKGNRGGLNIKIQYDWAWMESYVQGRWMNSKHGPEHTWKQSVTFNEKGDTSAIADSRANSPRVEDKIVAAWRRDYGKNDPTDTEEVLRYMKYLMWETKEIRCINVKDWRNVEAHTLGMLTRKSGKSGLPAIKCRIYNVEDTPHPLYTLHPFQ